MPDRADDLLRRALQEDRAASRATSIEARLSHQRLAVRLRHMVAQMLGRAPEPGH